MRATETDLKTLFPPPNRDRNGPASIAAGGIDCMRPVMALSIYISQSQNVHTDENYPQQQNNCTSTIQSQNKPSSNLVSNISHRSGCSQIYFLIRGVVTLAEILYQPQACTVVSSAPIIHPSCCCITFSLQLLSGIWPFVGIMEGSCVW